MNEERFQNQVEDSQPEKIENRSIRELEVPLTMILAELRDRISSGAYSVIVGDDVSGRIPARILAGVVKEINREDHRVAPEVRFVAGSAWLYDEKKKIEKIDAIADVVEKAMESAKGKGLLGERILFVTETISQGRTVLAFAKACEKVGIHFDVATATYHNKEFADQALADVGDPNMQIAYGYDKKIPNIFYDRVVSGFDKNPQDLHAHQLPPGQFDKDIFMSARKDVNVLVERLLRYWKEFPSERKRVEDVYTTLAAMRDELLPDYKKALTVIGSSGHAYLYSALKERGRGEKLEKFASLYEKHRKDPVFQVLVRQQSKEEQDILILLQRTAEEGRPPSEALKKLFKDLDEKPE